jgi:FXSXX-COOH protein
LTEADLESDLPDFASTDLRRLAELPPSVLVTALRRVLAENDDGLDQYAAFQNAV